MRSKHLKSPSISQLVQKKLTRWMLWPFIALLVLLGVYAAYEKSKYFESQNIVLTEFLGRKTTKHLNDANIALESLSKSIKQYDPFWFQWVLSNFLNAYTHFERLVYLSPEGAVLAASPQSNDLLAMPFLLENVMENPRILSNPTPSPATQNLVIYIGLRMDNGNILVGELSLSALQALLRDLFYEDDSLLILTDAYGNLISHPNFNLVSTQTNIGHLSIFKEKITNFQTLIFEDDGVTYLGTATRLQQSDWVLLFAKPVTSVFLPILSPLLALFTIILFIFFIFAHLLQLKLRDSVVKPLAMFTDSIRSIAQGQYQRPSESSLTFSELDIIKKEFGELVLQVHSREKETTESEERFRQLVENINEVFWIYDLSDNSIIYASPSYEMIWGRTRESLYENPESFFLAIRKQDRLSVIEAFNELAYKGKVFDEEFRITLPDGSERWVSSQSFPVYNKEGKRVRAVGVAEDVTERKTIQKDLIAAKQEAVFANNSKTQFLTNISHELRTPLNGILGMLQLLTRTRLDKEQSDYAQTAISSSKVLLNVINDILNVAQIEAGKLVLHKSRFSIFEMMEATYNSFKHTANSKGIDFIVDIEPGMPPVFKGDEVRIRQILFNIIGNSFKFTNEGHVSVKAHILPERRNVEKATILFIASDTGIGIPSDKIHYVFDSFTQVDETYTRRHQGTGLGLGIVKSLVDSMGGTIAVESELGEGTTVYLTIQLETPKEGEKNKPIAKPTESQNSTRSLFILVVEDDRINQIATCRMLENMGHTTLSVSNGKKAIEALAQKRFDCIFMDIQMPILDGIEATRRIRTLPELSNYSKIPIIALTAHAMPEDEKAFIEVGMDGYISKPASFEELNKALKDIL